MPRSIQDPLTSTAVNDAIVYNSLTPRIGLTYALNDSRTTIARASYAAFADQVAQRVHDQRAFVIVNVFLVVRAQQRHFLAAAVLASDEVLVQQDLAKAVRRLAAVCLLRDHQRAVCSAA